MHESPRKTTPAARWLRFAALAALLALGLHAGAVLGHHHDAGGDQDCVFCHAAHVPTLGPDSHAPPRALPAVGGVASEPAALANWSSRELPFLRGPPAV